jgi:hypothetical protein
MPRYWDEGEEMGRDRHADERWRGGRHERDEGGRRFGSAAREGGGRPDAPWREPRGEDFRGRGGDRGATGGDTRRGPDFPEAWERRGEGYRSGDAPGPARRGGSWDARDARDRSEGERGFGTSRGYGDPRGWSPDTQRRQAEYGGFGDVGGVGGYGAWGAQERYGGHGGEYGRRDFRDWEQGRGIPPSGRPGEGSPGSDARWGAEGAGAARRARGPKGWRRSDERIHDEVCERIARSGLDAGEVEVKVEGARVVLAGAVPDRETKWRLEDLAEEVFGVEEVENGLRVTRAEQAGRADEPTRH